MSLFLFSFTVLVRFKVLCKYFMVCFLFVHNRLNIFPLIYPILHSISFRRLRNRIPALNEVFFTLSQSRLLCVLFLWNNRVSKFMPRYAKLVLLLDDDAVFPPRTNPYPARLVERRDRLIEEVTTSARCIKRHTYISFEELHLLYVLFVH